SEAIKSPHFILLCQLLKILIRLAAAILVCILKLIVRYRSTLRHKLHCTKNVRALASIQSDLVIQKRGAKLYLFTRLPRSCRFKNRTRRISAAPCYTTALLSLVAYRRSKTLQARTFRQRGIIRVVSRRRFLYIRFSELCRIENATGRQLCHITKIATATAHKKVTANNDNEQ